MNIAQLTQQASLLRRKPLTPETRTAIENLRAQADNDVVRAQFDTTLRLFFGANVFGSNEPQQSVTSMGTPAKNAAAGGTKGGAALAFHAARDPQHIADTVRGRVPELKTTTPPPMPIEAQFAPLTAYERKEQRRDLQRELDGVPVTVNGERASLLFKLVRAGLNTDRMLDVLAQVKVGYERVAEATGNKPPGYQDVNWKHTRLELDRVLDVVANMKLSPEQAEVAVLASCLSDSVKDPSNFIVHNVHGAEAALHVLARLVPPPSTNMIEDVVRATLEHQIGPPSFMAHVALTNLLKGAGVDVALVHSIAAKVAHPLAEKNLTPDKAQIAFTDDEKNALAKVGVFAWTVPHADSRHYGAARAVIDADSLVNYACPDGWAKLAALHGPDQPPFLQEPRLNDSLLSLNPAHASAIKSYYDAANVVSPQSKALYASSLQRTKDAIGRVNAQLEGWVAALPADEVPRTKTGGVPYLDDSLDYTNGPQVAFARRLRNEAVRLLREQEVDA